MKVVVAIDSLKGSLSSLEAGLAAREGIHRVYPEAGVDIVPVADGGEGTTEALIYGMGGKWQETEVLDPLGRKISCCYGIIEEKKTAVIEMAAAAGITLLKPEERNPLKTTTYGVGQLICDAIKNGCRSFILGIGGSATNDGGAGMLQALGFDLQDETGKAIPYGAEGLSRLHHISKEHVIPNLAECSFRIACDVTNPLCGSLGCSNIFGPQKGADSVMIQKMDQWLEHFAELTQQLNPKADPSYPGAGAAGGLGFAFLAYTKAVLESGIQIVLKETALEEKIKEADLILTGEGKIDEQTAMGKAPAGIAKMAKKYNKPVIALGGAIGKGADACNREGIDAFFPIVRKPVSLEKAMQTEEAKKNMADTVEQLIRLIQVIEKCEKL